MKHKMATNETLYETKIKYFYAYKVIKIKETLDL